MGFGMIDQQYKIYLINSRIKDLNGKINCIGTEEDAGESIENLQAKIQALTNLLEML
jgi:cell division protein FtsL